MGLGRVSGGKRDERDGGWGRGEKNHGPDGVLGSLSFEWAEGGTQ